MKPVEEAFVALWGRQPSDKEKQRLMRERDALHLKDNDTLWRLLVVLGHHETLYAEIPARIAKVASDVTDNVKAAADFEFKTAAARTRAELAKAVAQTAHDIAGRVASARRLKWVSLGVVVACGAFVGIGASGFRFGLTVGDSAGRLAGYATARDEKAASAWANTAEGQLAHSLANAGSLRDLATCTGRGWKVKEHTCVPRCERGTADGWNIPRNDGR